MVVHVVSVRHHVVLWVLIVVWVRRYEERIGKEGWLWLVGVPGAMWLPIHYGWLVLPRLPSYLRYAPGVTGVIAVVMKSTFKGMFKFTLLFKPRIRMSVDLLRLHRWPRRILLILNKCALRSIGVASTTFGALTTVFV